MKPKLFILKMPFVDDSGRKWFCSHCAMIEGALRVNPDWCSFIDVRRIENRKPRTELIEIIGDENQWTPVLILNEGKTLKDPVEITQYLAKEFGGASPHP